MSFYCISVHTGMEEKYKSNIQELLNSPEIELKGKIYFLKKKMRLKTGKEYFEPFFPGYVFFETNNDNPQNLNLLKKNKYFYHFLPSNNNIAPLSYRDLNIITTILNYGNIIDIIPVTFDENDKIVIIDGPFKDYSGKVISVNRRNKRVNIQIDFLNDVKVIGLSYEVIKKKE